MKTAIVTDSNSGISQAEAEQLGISVLPMPFIAGEDVYHEGKNLTTARFYELLSGDTVLRTSQPSPGGGLRRQGRGRGCAPHLDYDAPHCSGCACNARGGALGAGDARGN